MEVPLPVAARCAAHVMANGVPGESESVSWGCAGLSHFLYSARLVQSLLDDKAEKENMGMIDKALNFCFPDLQPRSGELGDFNERTFAFAITDGDGQRSYGVCRRVLGVKHDRVANTFRVEPDGRGVFAVCIVTRQPWMAFFFQLVNVVASLALERSLGAALTFVARVTKLGTVPPCQTVTLAVPGEPPQSAALTRAADDIDLLPLMSSLDASHCVALFASVLFDRRVLLLSSNLERASLCVLALGELLRPFRWHHIFIPVLPAKWIDYTMAPMPYICAMHASSRAALEKYPLDDVVIVDLDDRSVAFFEDDLDLVPPARLSKLIHVVEKAVAAYHKSGAFDNAAVKHEFLRFFASMMTGYRDFLRVDDKKADDAPDAAPTCSIDLDAFLATKKGKIRSFMDAFVLSQHFEQFVKQAEQPEQRHDLFESLAADKTSRAKKLLKLPQTLTRTLRGGHGTMVGGDKPAGYSGAAAAAGAPPAEEVGAFQCTLCERSYTFEADLSIHMMKRHRGPDNADGTYQCSLCERSYGTPEDLAFHLKKRHEAYSSMPSMRTQTAASATYNPFEERKSLHVRTNAPTLTAASTTAAAAAAVDAVARQLSKSSDTFSHTAAAATQTFNKANDQYSLLPTQASSMSTTSTATMLPSVTGSTPPSAQYGFLPTSGGGGGGGAGDDGAPSAEDAVLKLLGGAADGKKVMRRSGTTRKLNLAAGQQLVPTDDMGGVLAKAAESEGDEEVDVIDELEDEKPLDKEAKRANRMSVFAPQRNQKQIVLTVDVPFYGMSKKLSFNPEHKISHIVSQITDTAFFQQTRKANQKAAGRVDNVQYALHVKKEVNGSVKTIRLSNLQQLSEFGLRDNDRVILLEVRLPPATAGALIAAAPAPADDAPAAAPTTPTPATTTTASRASGAAAGDDAATLTWGATHRPMTSPRNALLGSSRSARGPTTIGAAAAAATADASPVPATPEEKKRPDLPHKNATVLQQKFKAGAYTTSDIKAAMAGTVSPPAAPATPRDADKDYDSFDPVMRMPLTVKLRAIVGDNPDELSFVNVTLKQRDKVGKCMDFIMAGCEALLPDGHEREQFALFKRRKDGTFALLPSDVILAAASLVDGDSIFVRLNAVASKSMAERNDTSGSTDSTISTASVSTSTSGGNRSAADSGAALDPFQAMADELDDIVAQAAVARSDSGASDAHAAPGTSPARTASTSTYAVIPSSASLLASGAISSRVQDDEPTSAPATPTGAAAKTKRSRISKKVVVDAPLCDVWARVGDFFDLRWTGVDKCELMTSDAAAAAGIVSIGGDAAAMLASGSVQKTAPVGELREFRHSGSTRAIRHRCVAFKKPTPAMLQRPSGLVSSGAAAAGVDSCGYAYELAVESALVPRMPVCAYASELKLRSSVTNAVHSTTVEWTATIVVREEKVVDAVSEEIEKSLEMLRTQMAEAADPLLE
jgi:hypothetical protein